MTGKQSGLSVSDLPRGWEAFYNVPYATSTTSSDMKPKQGDCLLWGASQGESDLLSIAAFGARELIENKAPLWNHGVYWYIELGSSAGFSATGELILDPGDTGFYNCDGRLSWLLNGEGGYRAGCRTGLESDTTWRKRVFYGPAGVFCDESICPPGQLIKTDGLPAYCYDELCTTDECCEDAPTCTSDICPVGSLLKETLPSYCATAFCQEDECCVVAPTCQESDCGTGYFLKPDDTLPPLGQPANGCESYTCTRDECCNQSPNCTADVCTEGMVLTTLDPAPYCSSYNCDEAACCSEAGICSSDVCNFPYTLMDSVDLPETCDRPNCTQTECCIYMVPQVKATSLRFTDFDVANGTMGGTLSWVLPPSTVPNITRFMVYMGNSTTQKKLLGSLSSSTWTFAISKGTKYHPYLYVYTANSGGAMEEPATLSVVDSPYLPKSLTFLDLDLDDGEIGGYASWPDLVSNGTDGLSVCCQLSSWIRIESGYGNVTHGGMPKLYLLGERILADVSIPIGSITVVEFSEDLQSVSSYGVFRTSDSLVQAELFDAFLDANVSTGRAFAITTWGSVGKFVNFTELGLYLEATEAANVDISDAYSWIGVKRWPSPTWQERFVAGEHEVAADVEILCPIESYDVFFQNGGNLYDLGPLESSAHSVWVDMETLSYDDSLLELTIVTPFWEQTATSLSNLADAVLVYESVTYERYDTTSLTDLGGILSWSVSGPTSRVEAFNIYMANDEVSFADYRTFLAEVPGDATFLSIPSGTARNNATHLLIYAVSAGGEQSNPHEEELPAQDEETTKVVVALVSSVAALQIAKVLEALERSAKKMDNKDITDCPMRGKFLDADGNLVKIIGGGAFGFLPWRDPASQLFGPCGVNHHDRTLKISFKNQKELKKFLPFQRVRLRTRATMINTCVNAWDSDDLVLKKVSNKQIAVFGKNGDVTYYYRKPKLWWTFIEGSRLCSRKAIKIYAPMVALLGISFLIAYSGEYVMAAMMLVLCLMGVVVIIIASRMACTKEVIKVVIELPPKQIRSKFWKGMEVFVSCLPCAPAFLAGTTVGYITGIIGLLGSALRAKKCLAVAIFLEGFGGLVLTLYVLFVRSRNSSDGADTAKNTALIMATVLIMMKAVDTQVENQERLHSTSDLQVDKLIKDAEDAHVATGLGVWNAVALETFSSGVLEERLQTRLVVAMKTSASGVVMRAKTSLALYIEEMYQSKGARWPKNADQMAFSVGQAIDSVSKDICLKELAGCRSNSQRQEVIKKIEVLLLEMEESVRHLLSGALASKPVTRYKLTIKELNGSFNDLSVELKRAEKSLGSSLVAGVRGRSVVLSLYCKLLDTTASYVKDELKTGELTAVDLRLLFVKFEQMKVHAQRIGTVLECMPLEDDEDEEELSESQSEDRSEHSSGREPPDRRTPENALDLVNSNLMEAVNLMQGITHAPLPEDEEHALLEHLEEVLGATATLASFAAKSMNCNYEEEVLEDAEADIADRTVDTSSQEFFDETSSALASSRNAMSLAAAVEDELKAALQRAEKVVAAMAEARRQGYKVLHNLGQAREHIQGLSANQLRKLQKEAIEYTLAHPVVALVNLQELSHESAKQTHKQLMDDLMHLGSHLDTRGDMAVVALREQGKGKRGTLMNRMRRSIVGPTLSEEDEEVEEQEHAMQMIQSPIGLEPLFELRENALAEEGLDPNDPFFLDAYHPQSPPHLPGNPHDSDH